MGKINFEKNGSAQAALLSIVIGVLVLAFVNLGTDISDHFKTAVHNMGKLWIPGAGGIGHYSGKETLALMAWLISWGIFHQILKDREWNNRIVITIFLIGLGIATTLVWPPAWEVITHAVKG